MEVTAAANGSGTKCCGEVLLPVLKDGFKSGLDQICSEHISCFAVGHFCTGGIKCYEWLAVLTIPFHHVQPIFKYVHEDTHVVEEFHCEVVALVHRALLVFCPDGYHVWQKKVTDNKH